jgi:predicted metal-dependent peptidase
MNIAADIVVNQYIANWDLPKSAVTLTTFPDMELEADQSMEYYYQRLEELKEMCERHAKGSDPDGDAPPYPISMDAFRRIYGRQHHSDHSRWSDSAKAAQNRGLEEALENRLLNAANRISAENFGQIPEEIRQMVDGIREKQRPRIDWRRLMGLFAGSHGGTRISHTLKRISRRYGTRTGIRNKRTMRIVVVIDTSGSIDEDTLSLFLAEIEGIRSSDAEITIKESDAAVQACYRYRNCMTPSCKGGGGTDFDPAFQYFNSGKAGAADACIYLTDGYASEPTVRPRIALLWVLTPDGHDSPHLKWGKRISIKP